MLNRSPRFLLLECLCNAIFHHTLCSGFVVILSFVCSASISIEFEMVTANGVTSPMRKQVHNLVRNVAASMVRYCNAERVPAPCSVVDEMLVIASDKKRGSFHRFMALWVLWVSSTNEKASEESQQKSIAYARELVEVRKLEKFAVFLH